jgi:threonine dehydrogenase-like Zn-dependent dehydrogenase
MCLLAAQVLSQSSVIVCDLIEERLEVARRLGAIATFSPKTQDAQTVVSHTWGEGMADYVIDAVGSGPTKRMSLDLVRPGGTVVWVGLFENSFQFDSYPVTLQQKRVLGSYSGSQSDVRKAISILASKAVDVTSWVKPFSLEQGGEGFRAMLQGKGDNIKGVLDFSRDSH